MKRCIATLMLMLGGLWISISPAIATTVLGTGAATTSGAVTVNNTTWRGFQFTTGSSASNLQSIDIGLSSGNTAMTWYLYADAGSGIPANGASALASHTQASASYAGYVGGNLGTLSSIVFGGTLASYQLAPNTSYVLMLQMPGGLSAPRTTTTPTSTEGWNVSTRQVITYDSGSTWTTDNGYNLIFNLSAVPAPTPPPAPTPQPIPTLSEWAQIMMMLAMIASAGFYGWRMKQR